MKEILMSIRRGGVFFLIQKSKYKKTFMKEMAMITV